MSKISVNPFVPDMPTHNIGCVHIKNTGLLLESHEYAIEAIGGGGKRGKINAWLDIDQDDKECEVTLIVEDISIDNIDDRNLTKVLTFVNFDGIVEIVECGLADDGVSFYFPSYKMETEASSHLEQYLKEQGILVFVSVYAFRNDTIMPVPIFNKFMDCQIELKRCKEVLDQMEKKYKYYQKEIEDREDDLESIDKAHKKFVAKMESEKMELRKMCERRKNSFCF